MNKKLMSITASVATIILCAGKPDLPEIKQTSIWQDYDRYRESLIKNRFFKHHDVASLIQKHTDSKVFRAEVLGKSVQGRNINHLSIGKGKTKVLLWSQMHGDESTATMALFDIFNFLSADDENNSFRNAITENLELHFIPMVNPDGAEAWKRRNRLDIDINRDARALNTPEGKMLMDIADKIKPQFGFNLHDQSTLYSAGESGNPATISFLAPAYNHEKHMNEVRENATKLIVHINRTLQKYAKGKTAKYDDTHDPRCFGDTFQGKGISTILVESGGYPGDPEKQYIRKLNFYVILDALHSIATESYQEEDIQDYDLIPENRRSLYDLLVRNAEVIRGDIKFRTNIGINRLQIFDPEERSMSYCGNIEELSDMDKSFGYDELNASSMNTVPGKIKTMQKADWEKMSLSDEINLLKQGFLFVHFSDERSPKGPVKKRLLNLTNATEENLQPVGLDDAANFILISNTKPAYAVINGFVIDLEKEITALANSFGY